GNTPPRGISCSRPRQHEIPRLRLRDDKLGLRDNRLGVRDATSYHTILRSISHPLAPGVRPTPGRKVPMPSWTPYAVLWQISPLGFVGAERTAGPPGQPVTHRLPKLLDWLQYAVELGASGFALGPIFAAETHGYDTVDHFQIDPRLGDDADFDTLIAGAHA